MRRLLVLLAAIAACTYPAGAAADPPYDYAIGSGWVIEYHNNTDAHFAFTARDGASGVTGRMQLRFVYAASEETPTEEYSAEVVCLTVVGNTAVLSGLI